MRTVQLPFSRFDDDSLCVRGLWFTPDGRTLVAATGSPSKTFRLHWWDLTKDRHVRDAYTFEFVGGYDPDVEDYEDWPEPTVAPAAGLYAVWGWRVPSVSGHLSVSRFRHRVRRVARTVTPTGWRFDEAVFTPDGRYLLTSIRSPEGWREVLRWWVPVDLLPEKPSQPVGLLAEPPWRLGGHGAGGAHDLTLSGDGRRVGGILGEVAEVWDFDTGGRVAVLVPYRWRGQSLPLGPVALNSDGTRAALRCGRTLCVWEVGDPAGRPVYRADSKGLLSLAFTPDGRRLIAAPDDGPVRVIDPAARKILAEFTWEVGELFSAAVAPDGLTAAVGGDGGRVVIWDLEG